MMEGAKVYVDDHLCGAVDLANSGGKLENFIEVSCGGVVGKSIRFEREGGLGFCEITVFKGPKFPVELPEVYG